jgi:guanosine-3',5'-bis(diphosphate) 3'-pyrophosphohydrolase
MNLEQRAEALATEAHARARQVRKYTGEPYIEHPRAVVALVRSVAHDEGMLAAAWLHDTVEDTTVTIGDIQRECGLDVAKLVDELTDVSRPSDGNRKARKARDRDHLAVASPRAKTVKLADLIDNSASIVEHDPAFATVYLAEKRELLAVLTAGDLALLVKANGIAFATELPARPEEGEHLRPKEGAHAYVCGGPHCGATGRIDFIDWPRERALVDFGGGRRGGLTWISLAWIRTL